MSIQSFFMKCIPSMGVESGCQLVPEASRPIGYGPYMPRIAPWCDVPVMSCSAPTSGTIERIMIKRNV